MASVAPALEMGHTYAVRVRGFVYNTWSNYGSACNITIGNAPIGAGSRGSAPDEVATINENQSIQIVNTVKDELLAYPPDLSVLVRSNNFGNNFR